MTESRCKVLTLLFDWTPPEARGLGCGEEAPFSLLRTACGVAGAEVALGGGAAAGGRPREERGSCSEEEVAAEEEAAAASPGEQMEGSETLLVKAGGWSWSWACEACEELWSELEDRLSMLRAGEGEQEEGRD